MPQAKDPARRQRRNATDIAHRGYGNDPPKLALLPARTGEVPAGRTEWLATIRNEWEQRWKSDIASAYVPSDVPELLRLFDLKDERERAQRGVRRRRVVQGSTGQPVLNPLFKLIAQCDSAIQQMEDRFGGNLLSRLKSFHQSAQAAHSLEELNRALERDTSQSTVDPAAALLVAGSDSRRRTASKPRG